MEFSYSPAAVNGSNKTMIFFFNRGQEKIFLLYQGAVKSNFCLKWARRCMAMTNHLYTFKAHNEKILDG